LAARYNAAMEALGVDKGLQQKQRMTEPCPPIGRHTPLGQRQYTGADIGPAPAGQDQEVAVIGDQVQPAILRAKVPAYPM